MSSAKEYIPDDNEKILSPICGFIALAVMVVLFILMIPLFLIAVNGTGSAFLLIIVCLYWGVIFPCLLFGLRIINPNESAVYVLFGKYYGTLLKEGFYFVNPFCTMINPTAARGDSKKISRKATAFNSVIKDARDAKGDIIEINTEIIWRIENAAKAVFSVDNYISYIELQCGFAVRHAVRKFHYCPVKEANEKDFDGNMDDISVEIKAELQKRLEVAGAEIMEVRISSIDKISNDKISKTSTSRSKNKKGNTKKNTKKESANV